MSNFSNLDIERQSDEFKKLRRLIEDYLRKYASLKDLQMIHKLLIERGN